MEYEIEEITRQSLPDGGYLLLQKKGNGYSSQRSVFRHGADGKVLYRYPLPRLSGGMAVSPDGKSFLVSNQTQVYHVDVASKEVKAIFKGKCDYCPRPVAFSQDGQLLAYYNDKRNADEVVVLGTDGYPKLATLSTDGGYDSSNPVIGFLPDGKSLALVRSKVSLFDMTAPKAGVLQIKLSTGLGYDPELIVGAESAQVKYTSRGEKKQKVTLPIPASYFVPGPNQLKPMGGSSKSAAQPPPTGEFVYYDTVNKKVWNSGSSKKRFSDMGKVKTNLLYLSGYYEGLSKSSEAGDLPYWLTGGPELDIPAELAVAQWDQATKKVGPLVADLHPASYVAGHMKWLPLIQEYGLCAKQLCKALEEKGELNYPYGVVFAQEKQASWSAEYAKEPEIKQALKDLGWKGRPMGFANGKTVVACATEEETKQLIKAYTGKSTHRVAQLPSRPKQPKLSEDQTWLIVDADLDLV